MLLQLIKFEFIYQSRQLAFWVFSAVFFLFGWMIGRGIYAPEGVIYNSTYHIAKYTSLLSLMIVFAIMFQVVSGVLRDHQFGFSELFYSTPVRKRDYFISRFFGVFIFSLFVMTAGMLGIVISASLVNVEASRLVAIDWGSIFGIWGGIVLPTILIMTAAIFSVAILTKNALSTYITAVFIYALYWLCALFLNSPMLAQAVPADPANLFLAALADPFGLSAFFEQTQYWTTFEKNYSTDFYSGSLKWNRYLWCAFSVCILWLAYRFTSFCYRDTSTKEIVEPEEKVETFIRVHQSNSIEIDHWKYHWATLRNLLKIDLSYIVKSLPFLAGIITWLIIVFTEIYARVNASGDYSESSYPTTGYLIELIREPLPFLALLLIVFYSGELIWRSRTIKTYFYVDVTPVSNGVFFLSKIIALFVIPVILIVVSILVAVGFQLANNYYDLEPALYLSMLYFDNIRPLLYILLAVFIQTIMNNKYLAMFVSGLFIILFGSSLVDALGIEHPMLQINRLPQLLYSDMLGYGDYGTPYNYYVVYWCSFGLLLVLASFSLWRRGMLESLISRIQKAWSVQTKRSYTFWSIAALLFFMTSGNLWYHLHLDQVYTSTNARLDIQADYEHSYKKYADIPRLHQVALKLEVDLFPMERKYDYRASYTLENKNSVPVHEVLLSEREQLLTVNLENATLIKRDSLLSIWLFALEKPLLPGERIHLTYEISKQEPVLNPGRQIVKNGSFLLPMSIDPVLGYRTSREITDVKEREKRNLPPRVEETAEEHHLHTGDAVIGKVPYEAILSTDADQIALTSGDLLKTWTVGNRRYFSYKTPERVVPLIGIISGKYEVQKDTVAGIILEQYYHPEHHFNIDSIKRYTLATLDYCNKKFGNYPFDHLRIAEIPRHWPFGGIAMPGMIGMVEDRLYLVDIRDTESFNLVAKRTIHEVGHQWWGHLLMAKDVEGGSLFVEGFAKYTEAVVLERLFGKWSLIQVGKAANRRYFSGRSMSSDPEPGLFLSEGEGYLSYGKMYTVMLAMKALIGEGQVNVVLQKLIEKHGDEIDPTVISTELLEAFYQVAPKQYHELIDDWFKKVINYDLKIENAVVSTLQDGRYEVIIDIHANRFETLEDGSEKAIKVDEPILVGLFPGYPEDVKQDSDIIYLAPHQISASEQRISIIVNERPTVVAIDPYLTRLDKNWADNYKELD